MSERLRGFFGRVAVLGALAVVGTAVAKFYEGRQSAALIQLAEQISKSDSVLATTRSELAGVSAQRDSARREKVVAEAAAQSARAQARVADEARRVFAVGAARAPDTCASILRDASAAIRASIVEAERWQAAYDTMSARALRLERSLDLTTAVAGTLQERLAELRNAGRRVVVESKGWKRLLPRVGVGAAVGFDPLGKPNAVTGVTVGWQL